MERLHSICFLALGILESGVLLLQLSRQLEGSFFSDSIFVFEILLLIFAYELTPSPCFETFVVSLMATR